VVTFKKPCAVAHDNAALQESIGNAANLVAFASWAIKSFEYFAVDPTKD